MNKNINHLIPLILSTIFGIITLIIFSIVTILLKEFLIICIGLPFSISIFCFFLYLMQNKITRISLELNVKYLKNDSLILYFLTIASILAVIVVPSYEGSIDWARIPSLLNWLRYGSALLLTTFLPGYFLLKILDKREMIKGGALIVLSCLVSFFMMFIIGFSVLLCGSTITTFVVYPVAGVNIALMTTYSFLRKERKVNLALTMNCPEMVLFISILATVMTGSIALMIYCSPLSYGDMWRELGAALQWSEGFPGCNGVLMPGAPYLFSIYLAVLISLSGISPATSIQLLYFLGFIPTAAFYYAIKELIDKRDVKNFNFQLIATFLSTLLGFGSLYAIYLKLNNPMYDTLQLLWTTTSKTYDIYARILFLPDYVTRFWYIGLPCFFMLLYLMGKNELGKITRFSLIAIVTLTAYLGHIAEVIIFVVSLLVYDLFSKHRFEWDRDLPLFIGVVLVALVDLMAPSQGYIFITNNIDGEKTVSLPFLITLSLSVLIIVASVLRSTLVSKSSIGRRRFLNICRIWKYARWILLYFYLFSVVIWLILLSYDYEAWSPGGERFVPFFIFPLRFGSVGLLVTLSLFAYLPEIVKDKKLALFFSLITVSFTLEQISSLCPSIGNWYFAYRYATFAFVGSCVLATYGIKKSLSTFRITTSSVRMKKKIISCTLLFLSILPSMISTSLYYVHVSSYYRFGSITKSELDALNYIKQNLSSNASIITFSDAPRSGKLYPFAKVNPIQNLHRYSNILLNELNPYVLTYILGLSGAKYVYMTQRDYEILNNSKGIFKDFLPYFPKVFVNDAVTIYEIPQLSPPSSPSSDVSLELLHFSHLIFETSDAPSVCTWIDDSFAEGWHQHKQYGKIKNHGSEVKNGIMKIWVTSNQSGNVWVSYALSGLSLNTTTYSTLSFKYRVENNLTWFTLQLWNSSDKVFFYIGHLTDKDFTTEVFSLPKNQIVTKIEIIAETVNDAPVDTTACAYIDYIKFSPQIQYWKDDTFLRDWSFYKQYGDVYDWSAYSEGDVLKINVTSNHSGNVWISYSLPLNLKTKNSILSFRYRVDNDYTWFTIILQNASHRPFSYKGHLTDKTFTTKSYLLPDDQTITRIEIIVETTDKAPPRTSAIAYIDYVEISQKPYSREDVLPALFAASLHSKYSVLYVDDTLMKNLDSYISHYKHILLTSDPLIPIQTLTNWVSTGNTLTVLNTHGNGFFANLLGINSSSPLLTIKGFGQGKILYVNAYPLVEAGKEYELLQPEFLEKVREALTLREYIQRVNVLPVYNSTFGSIEINGDLNVATDILILRGSLNLTGSPFPFNNSAEIEIYGKVNLVINNASLLIFPLESYILIKPRNCFVEGEVLVENPKALRIVDANAVYSSDVPVSFRFKATELYLYARLPSINASGTIAFDQLDVHAALYVPLAGIVQQKAEVQGNVKFSTMYISSPLIMFSTFQADGEILNLAETTHRPSIPWFEVLTSPYNLIFNTIFLLCIIAYIVKKRGRRNS